MFSKTSAINNDFILEFKAFISTFDVDQYEANFSMINEATLSPIFLFNPEVYTQYIDKAIESISTVSADTETLDAFFSKVYKSASLTDRNIAIPLLPYEDIDKIRPEYLSNIPLEFNTCVKKVLSGQMSEGDIRKMYASGEYFSKVKKQLVKTTVQHNDLRDLLIFDSPAIVKIDNVYVQNNIIPFIRSYPQIVKELSIISLNTKGRINQSYSDLQNSLKAITSINIDDPKKVRTLSYMRYNIVRQYMNLCAYIVSLLIRKIRYYTFNMMSYVNLYNTFYNYFPEGELVLHESVIDGDIKDIDDSTLLNSLINSNMSVILPHIQQAIGKKKMEISNMIAHRYNYRFNFNEPLNREKYPYDTYPYAATNRSFIEIINDLHNLEMNYKDPNLIVDDLLRNCHLDDTFIARYDNTLTNLNDVSFYTKQMSIDTDGSTKMSIFNDISRFEKNVAVITTNINKAYNYIQYLIDNMSVNTTDMDTPTYNEMKDVLNKIMKNFKDYVLLIGKKLIDRLDSLTDLLDDSDNNEEMYSHANPEEFIPYDYSFEAAVAAYDDIEEATKQVFENLMKIGYQYKNKVERGVKVVFEADNEAPAPTVKTDAKPQNEQNDMNNQATQNTNNNQNTNNTQTTNTTDAKKTLIQKFKELIQKIIDKFMGKSNALTRKNNRWLNGVKDKILALDFANTTITVAPYETSTLEGIGNDITGAINQINTINANDVQSWVKSDAIYHQLFNRIPANIAGVEGFDGRVKHFYTYGPDPKTDLSVFKADDAKTKVDDMIKFCLSYDNMSKTINKRINDLTKAASDKQQEIINANGKQSTTTESAIDYLFEAPDTNTTTAGKPDFNVSNVITSACRTYTGAVLTIVERHYLDYIKVLRSLAPENATPEPATDGNEAKKEDENNQ